MEGSQVGYPYHPRSFLKDSSTSSRTSPGSFRSRMVRMRGSDADAGHMALGLSFLIFPGTSRHFCFGTAPEGTGHFIVDADEKLTALMGLELAIQGTSEHVGRG